MSSRWFKILDADALPEGSVRALHCDGRSLCAVRQNGRVAVFEDVCPHQGAPLSTGWLWQGLVICPWHGWAYEPHTGKPSHGLGAPLQLVRADERPDGIYVEMASAAGDDPLRSP